MIDWLAYFEGNKLIVKEFGECRFEHDHLMADTGAMTVVIDGLILNQKELFVHYHTDSFLQLVLKMQQEAPNTFFNAFRGPFTGLFFDKNTKKAIVFTNQTGDSAVFYHISDKNQIFSSNFSILLNYLKENQILVSLDEKASHWMLTFGYLIDEATFANEIKRLRAGKALYLENGGWTEKRYHQFLSKNLQITEDEAITKIDTLFRQAVKRCFDKDLEYGYKHHLADMSAGMDSRMVNCVAKSLGYGPITNISYSQTGSEEEVLSKKASEFFGNEMIFNALDAHEFVFDIDELLQGNFGTYLYSGITGGACLLSSLDFTEFGAEQTGQLGDIAIGTFVKTDDIAVNPDAVRLSHKLPLRFDPNPERFENLDLYSLYTRGFMGAMSSWFIRKHYTFALSPFIDVDFMEFCYALPIAMRRGHNLYWKWVKKYYPDALDVPTSRRPVPTIVKLYRKGLKAGRKVFFKLGVAKSRVRSDSSMNPYEYWYDTDPKMRAFFNDYYHENINLTNQNNDLKNEIETLFNSPVVLEKIMALTVLGMAKMVCSNQE